MVAEAPFGELGSSADWNRLTAGTGTTPLGAMLARLPHGPRCKLCRAPSKGWGGFVASLVGHRVDEPGMLCRSCAVIVASNPADGIADVSVIHADITGSAVSDAPMSEWRAFERIAADGIEAAGGAIDVLAPDRVHAFFVARDSGDGHAARAYEALAALFVAAADSGLSEADVEISAGLSSGRARVGTVRTPHGVDFTATGDIVEMAHRLAAAASGGEALVALESWRSHSGPVAQSRMRTVAIPGHFLPVDAVVVRGSMEATI